MAWGEGIDLIADWVEALQFAGEVDGTWSGGGATNVEGGDSDGIACGDQTVLLLVVKHPAEHAVEVSRNCPLVCFLGNVLLFKERTWEHPIHIARTEE